MINILLYMYCFLIAAFFTWSVAPDLCLSLISNSEQTDKI